MLSDKLRYLRREKNLTQEELGKILNVSHGTIAMWETNKRLPDIETIYKLSKIFNVTTDFLIGREDIKKNIEPQINNTIVVFGRGEGRKEYQVTEEQLKALTALIETMKNTKDEDKF